MKYFRFAKLVRDKIPEYMEADNQMLFGVRRLGDAEYIKELSKKVIEEARELASADNFEDIKEELADIQEILDCLKKALKIDEIDMKEIQGRKIDKNSAFNKRIYIGYIGCKDDSKWTDYYMENQDRYPQIEDLENPD